MNTTAPTLSISVVSHGQMGLVSALLQDLARCRRESDFELILTLNVPEPEIPNPKDWPFALRIVQNPRPLGFGANHNQALRRAQGDYFCVLNPDIRLPTNPWPALLAALQREPLGVLAPLVLNAHGTVEDSVRRYPTPARLWAKLRGRRSGPDYTLNTALTRVDWVGGMFMVIPRSAYERVGGFDEGYFLYYEDVDLCARMNLAGLGVGVLREAQVIHNAQRASHRHWAYLRRHVGSLLRYLRSDVYRQLRQRGCL
ncbi:MAG: hypothetical protein OHK0048_02930 [Rhodoferax sp.]